MDVLEGTRPEGTSLLFPRHIHGRAQTNSVAVSNTTRKPLQEGQETVRPRMDFTAETIKGTITHIHPNKFIRVATPLYKRRGKLTSTVRSDWVGRLFVLTDTALFWYRLSEDLGGPQAVGSELLGTQQGRVDVRHVVSIKQVEVHGE